MPNWTPPQGCRDFPFLSLLLQYAPEMTLEWVESAGPMAWEPTQDQRWPLIEALQLLRR